MGLGCARIVRRIRNRISGGVLRSGGRAINCVVGENVCRFKVERAEGIRHCMRRSMLVLYFLAREDT